MHKLYMSEKNVYCSFQTYDGRGGGGDGKDSSRQNDDVGGDTRGTGGGGTQENAGNLSDDNRAIKSGHGRYSILLHCFQV